MCCLSLIFPAPIAFAAPQGGKVVGGSANIHQSGTTTTINQSSDRAIINWHSFDIGKNEAVRHNMPSPKSAGLHRVVGGGGASQIQGLLQSNGNIYLVNPAGVVIHKGARVDTNSFIATTRDIADSNFMKGKMVFDRPGRQGAKIINQGAISVKESGLAALVAPTVRNEGLIAGKLGKVALASGDSTWKLDMHGDDLITFTVNENDVNALHATDGTPLAGAGVENSGSIKAEGGVVVLTAAQLDGIVGSVVNSGEVSAASAEVKGGKITFRGEGSHVDVRNTGIVDASSAKADGGVVRMVADGAVASSGAVAATGGQKGGKAVLTGRDVALTGTTKIDVSGATGGGTALVGGNALGKGPERNARTAKVESGAVIHADANSKGDGGQVVVWSDEKTSFDGSITAKGGREGGNGGMVETSGKSLKVGDTARVNTSAPQGKVGQWLLDPVDFTIAASGGDMTGATVSANLEMGDVIIQSDSGNSGTNGDILVNDTISWAADTHLTLDAYRNVNINADITAIGATAGLNILPQNGVFNLAGSKITLSGANPSLSIAGQQYIIINSIQSLQDVNKNLNGYYALGSDIDAVTTVSWNDGKGFNPIGTFSGYFNGNGHVISCLTINRPYESGVGLFSATNGAHISNIWLYDVNITGGSYTGGLSGELHTYDGGGYGVSINNVHINGKISGKNYVGGISGSSFDTIKNSSSSCDVFGVDYVGGITGRNSGRYIINSCSSGNIYGEKYIGGFVGKNEGSVSQYGHINNCYSVCSVSGLNGVGGFVGYVDSYSNIFSSYNTGHVTGESNSGGFVGLKIFGSESYCYWDIETSGQSISAGGTGLTSSQMKMNSSFGSWDFDNIWTIEEGKNYPQLRWVAENSNKQPDQPVDPEQPIIPNPDNPNQPENPELNTDTNSDNMHISQIIRYSKDEQKLIDGVDLYVVELLPNSPQDEQNVSEGTQEKQKNLNNFMKIGQDAINSIKEKIGKNLYAEIKSKNSSKETALAKIRKQIKFTPTMIGVSNITIPDGVYEAFAQSIIDSIGASKVDKYSNNMNEMMNQLYHQFSELYKSYSNEFDIDGTTYNVHSNTMAFGGAGNGLCTVEWKDKNGKHFSVNLVWASNREECMESLAEYCLALSELNKESWKEAASYVLTGTPSAKKYFNIGEKIINAICDKEYAKEFGKEIGGSFAKEFTGGFFQNKFESFIEKNIPNGSDIIGAAKAMKQIENKYNDIAGLITQSKDFSKEKDDLLSVCNLLMSHYNYAANEVGELERVLGL